MYVELKWFKGVGNSIVFIQTVYKQKNVDSTSDLSWLARAIAAEQSVHPTGLCPMCGEPLAAAALHEFCYPPATPSG